ncbi:MAG: T9SS type A sorting domain-containing protein, partial [Bacteroidales bacterium]|nr:T9SS type A sorting domain-containing protein [Bacteroidales bacterium]
VNLSLFVNPIYIDTIFAEICPGGTYSQYGFNESATGFYTQSLQTFKGCDSIVNLSLIVNPIYNDTIFAKICSNETYVLNGFNENTTGFYTQNLQTIKGCDSIVNLSLIVNHIYSDTIFGDICQGETYNLNGFNENTTGFYTQNLQTINGCDSIINLSLNVNPKPITPSNLVIILMAPYLELRWEGDGTSYDIYRDDVFVANSQQPYYIDYNVINGETYTYYVKSFNGDCESEFSNPISMIYVGLDDIKTDNITTKLYPNPSDGKAKLNVEGLNTEADVLVYDMVGRIVQRHSLNKGKNHLEIDLSGYAKGVYSVRIVNESVNQTLKLIVR